MQIVSPTYLACALSFMVLMAGLLLLSFYVRVPVSVTGQGVLMAGSDVASFAILPESEGRLEEFLVQRDSPVKRGQVIARVSNPRLQSDIETAQIALQGLVQKLKSLEAFQADSMKTALKTLSEQRNETKNRDLVLRERLTRLDKAIEGDTDLIKRGFLSSRGADSSITERGQVEDQLFTSRRQLIEAEAAFAEFKQRFQREKLDLGVQVSNQERQLQALLERKKIEGLVISPYDGLISELLVDLHQPVTRDRRIATIVPSAGVGQPVATAPVSTALIFVPATQGKKIVVGMPVQLLPLIYDEQEYGRIEGVVQHISSSAADDDTLLNLFKNQKLVRKLFDEEASYKLEITLTHEAKNPSGLAWSGSRGPDKRMEPGTIVSGWVIYNHPRLIDLLVPALKRWAERAWITGSYQYDFELHAEVRKAS